jgi:ABC-2 type transport system permease protein
MKQIFLKEFAGFFGSLIGYLVMAAFLIMAGLFTWVFPDTSVPDYGFADLDIFFSVAPYILIFLIPALTMRLFAEERKMGTLELLLTRPLSVWEIVAGKYAAVMALTLLTLAPTGLYGVAVWHLGQPKGNLDVPGMAGAYFALALMAGLFAAIGLWTSALTTNQIVSFLLSAFFCFTLYAGIDSLAGLFSAGQSAQTLRQFGALYHYESVSRALIDSRDLVYFISTTALFLFFTVLRIKFSV